MKKLLTAVLAVFVMFSGCLLTACNSDPVTFTYVALVNNTTGFTATDAQTGIAVGIKKDSPLKDSMNTYLNTLTTEYKENLMEKMVALANSDTATYTIDYDTNHSTANGTLKVGMECAYTPFNWTQNDNSNGAVPIANVAVKYANGYDVQIIAKVAAELGYALEIYQYSWEALVPAVKAGTLDAIAAGMSPTEERLAEIDFTVTYYQSNLVVVTREGSKIASATTLAELDVAGVKIAAQPGTFHLDALNDQTTNITVIDTYADFVDMQIALESGLIDGYVAEKPTAMAFCANA